MRDEGIFGEFISKLGILNANLKDVILPEETDIVRIVTGVLGGLTAELSIALQQAPSTPPCSLLSLAIQVKQMKSATAASLPSKVNVGFTRYLCRRDYGANTLC